jgi:tripartite-type tricarboxylate transporter receptor subunit TctC
MPLGKREPTMSRGAVQTGTIAIGLMLNAIAPASAPAQNWPTRPMTMVVPYAAGGTADVVTRVVAGGLSQILGQQVVVENIGGGGGMIGAHRVAKAAPDGYTLVLGTVGTHAQGQTLYKKPPYNPVTDFAPVALISEQPVVLVARKDLPANNLQEFIAYTKVHQAKMQYGSAGAGSGVHLACVLLNAAIGVNVTHVPYRGGGPAMQDLIAGRIDYQCPVNTLAMPQIEGKTIKAIATLTRARSPSLPGLASAHEQGLADFDAPVWYAIFLPKGTPAAIVRKLNDATVALLNTPAMQERMREVGADPVATERRSPEYLQRFVESEIKRWAGPIKASGVAMD